MSSRFGTTPITVVSGNSSPMADPNVHTLSRMKSPTGIFRYAGAGRNLYRLASDGLGAYGSISGAYGVSSAITSIARSGNVVTVVTTTPVNPVVGKLMAVYAVTGAATDFNGPFPVASVISSTSFTYAQVGPSESGTGGVTASASGYSPGNPFSGNPFSSAIYRPNGSSLPYSFFCDSVATLKDNGSLANAQLMGIDPVPIPPLLSLGAVPFVTINDLAATTGLTSSNLGSLGTGSRVNTTLSANVAIGIQTVALASMTNVVPGMFLTVGSETVWVISITSTTITANFTATHLSGDAITDGYISGSVAAGTTGYVQQVVALDLTGTWGGQSNYDNFLFDINLSDPTYISEIRILFDVGDGSFTQDYYWLSGTIPADQLANTGGATVVDAIQTPVLNQQYFQLQPQSGLSGPLQPGDFYFPVGVKFIQGQSAFGLSQTTSRFSPPARNTIGLGTWARLSVERQGFSAVGMAGLPGHDWSSVVAWRIQVTLGSGASGPVTVYLDNFALTSGIGPDSTGGVGYDYRITRYNATTMAEGNPSPVMIAESWLFPQGNPITLAVKDPLVDGQVTHWRIYRRGGTLPTTWYLVKQLPIGQQSYTDSNPDYAIASAPTLSLTNDPPVTSNLQNPVLTSLSSAITGVGTQQAVVANPANIVAGQFVAVDTNEFEETVIVQQVLPGSGAFVAYFQLTHDSGVQVTAQTYPRRACKLSAISQGYGWFAGDPANPHFLYYSNPGNVEAVSPANYVEVGTPADPIMAVIDFRGQTFVATQTTWYNIVFFTSGIPTPVSTGAAHGLAGSFAWARSETAILYLSYDGVYGFGGQSSVYETEPVSWLFFGQNFGPTPALDPAQIGTAVLAFYNNEIFLAYTDVNGVRRRLIFSLVYRRFRPDDVPALSMLLEADKNRLLVGSTSGTWQQAGMVYQDRVGDQDITGYSGGNPAVRPMPISLRTQSLDLGFPKQDKIINEATFDVDTSGNTQSGQVLTVTGWFDETQISFPIGSVQSIGRHQQQVNINEGIGQLSRTCALQISGTVTRVVHFYQVDFRAMLDAEPRRSWDTYYLDFGNTPGYKVLKQGWWEYSAPDPAGVTVQAFLDGLGTPAFTFTLPQAQARTGVRVRFPATKCRLARFIGTSPSDFKIYSSSYFQAKSANSSGGYSREQLKEPV